MKNRIDKKLKKNFRLLLLIAILSGGSGTGFAATITCTPEADGSYLPGNTIPSCNNVVAATTTQSGGAGHYILTRSRLHETLTVGDTVVTANVTGGYSGVGNQYATGASGASISTGDLKFFFNFLSILFFINTSKFKSFQYYYTSLFLVCKLLIVKI